MGHNTFLQKFSMEYGFKQITSSPHHLKSNGLTEKKFTDPHLALLSHQGTALHGVG